MIFIRYDKLTGEIHCRCDVPDSQMAYQTGDDILLLDADPRNDYIDLTTLAPVPFPAQPTPAHTWDWPTTAWVLDLSLAEQQARARRNALLAACDWTQLPDVPLTTQDAWAEYRQALRDVPSQSGFPEDIQWPTPPT